MNDPWISDVIKMNAAPKGVSPKGWEQVDLIPRLEELERLRAIVAKLPKTADGVPIVPGMSVYVDWRDGGQEYEVLRVQKPHAHVVFYFDEPETAFCTDHVTKGEMSIVYSTRSAAEAARERGAE